ncbi:DMT family transporter [Streptomyces sp. NPDC001922]|uniref:DMT family transporter n=1 Tax=Streptomyces sp. NPDC001922 TaxID=3364624 RepID=UPI0036B7E814
MGVGVVFALCASVCMGTATVMQAMGARMAADESSGSGVSTLLLAVRRLPFIAGIGLDMLGFAAELVSLRTLPIFVVEAALASSLAVTAVVASRFLHISLRRTEWTAVVTVCCGLALLAVAAGREGKGDGDETLRLATLCASVGFAVVGWVVSRRLQHNRAAVLGLIAGLSFGLVALGVRMLPGFGVVELLTDPSTYTVIISGITGFLYLVDALQSGSVTAATAAMVIGESVGPAVFGVAWLGDSTRHGYAPLAALGFVLSIGSALALARFGEAEQQTATS